MMWCSASNIRTIGGLRGHEDLEGEALRHAILFRLVHQGCLAVGLEINARHPATGVGVPVDGQAILVIALKGTWILSVVDQDNFSLQSPVRLAPSRRVKWSLNALKSVADFSLVMHVWSGIFFHCSPLSSILKTYWGLYPPPR